LFSYQLNLRLIRHVQKTECSPGDRHIELSPVEDDAKQIDFILQSDGTETENTPCRPKTCFTAMKKVTERLKFIKKCRSISYVQQKQLSVQFNSVRCTLQHKFSEVIKC